MDRFIEIVARAYALAVQVQDDNRDEQVLQVLAEEVAGECAELLAHINQDNGAFGDDECKDQELVALAALITSK
jgi:hypothetical protein